jgi:hypothetical protein
MSVAAEVAVQAWINARASLTGGTLSRGAFLAGYGLRSPADGAYALLSRTTAGSLGSVVAESSNPSLARIQAYVFAGTVEAAEAAAADLASAFHELRGNPEPCGQTGVTVLCTDNVVEPNYVPQPADGGEQHCFQVAADFVLRKDT